MATPSRSSVLTKMHKVLKKHYKPVAPHPERTVLEHALYAVCLENAHYETADAAFRALATEFFDWNEVRVSTVKELSETFADLPEPQRAATNLKQILQSVFETRYAFDLEGLRKMKLGDAIKALQSLGGATPFVTAYVVQAALGGHAIPVDRGAREVFAVLGLLEDPSREDAHVAGLERAIAKSKGIEFGSLLHQLSAEFVANPYAAPLHEVLLEIAPECKPRLPKRPTRKAEPAAAAEAPPPPEPQPAATRKQAAAAASKKAPRKKAAPRGKRAPAARIAKQKPR